MNLSYKDIVSQVKQMLHLFETSKRSFIIPCILGATGSVLRLAVLGLFIPLIHLLFTNGVSNGLGKFAFILAGIAEDNPILVFVILLTVVATARSICSYFALIIVNAKVLETSSKITSGLIQRFMLFGQHYYDRTGHIKNVKRLDKLPKKASKGIFILYKLVVSVISIGLYAAALILISWPMAIVAIGFLALYLIIFQKFIADTESPPEQSEFMEDQLNADSHSVIANLNLIKISNMTRGELSNWANHLKIRMAAQLQAMKRKELINPVKDLSSILMLVAFAWFSSVLVTNSDFFAISQFIIFFLIMRQSVGAISNVLRFPNQWFNVHQNVIKIIDLMSDQGKHITQAGNSPIESISDRIELRHLDFKYPGSKKILRGVSCHFKYGQSNFICGLTGSGKTTILHLLLRLYDCPPSSIYWDHADIRDYELASFYDRIAYAGPNSIFFDESIRFNVTYGLGEVNDDKLIKAADDAQLTGFFQNLEHGYDAKVGEQGVRLSDGEKQRLALMRVFLKDADIVLLDEATSALDGENELSINNALRNQFGSKMIINITHNLSRINPEDHVVMLNNGKVVEEGSCRELLDNRKRFYRLLNSSIKSLPKNKSLYLAKGTKMTT